MIEFCNFNSSFPWWQSWKKNGEMQKSSSKWWDQRPVTGANGIWQCSRASGSSLFLRRLVTFLLVIGHLPAPQLTPCSIGQETSLGIKLPAGFVITQVADNSLCPNIFRLGISPAGEVYAAGPGYIRRLIDQNQNGIFDDVFELAEAPQTGAQGLFCGDGFVLAVGDNGVWEYSTATPNTSALPRKRMTINTGGEHQAHAIKLGADGWYYLIAGNHTKIQPDFFAGANSPKVSPRAGFLMRISPDFGVKEIVADGFRNPYDFEFLESGEFLVFDSDGERDIFLPWYRPTRLFLVQAGDDAGWTDEAWKRPSEYFDMPVEIASLGRGSPTAVCRYQAEQFPAEYRSAIFLGDWTFGRVIVVRSVDGEVVTEDFAYSTGDRGFAVTDMLIDRDGSLLVSVGGRGTTGAIYRISYAPDSTDPEESLATAPPPWEMSAADPLVAAVQRIAKIRGRWELSDWEVIAKILAEESAASERSWDALIRVKGLALSLLVGRSDWPSDPQVIGDLVDGLGAVGQQPSLLKFLPQIVRSLEPEMLRRLQQQPLDPLVEAAVLLGQNVGHDQRTAAISKLLFQMMQPELSTQQKRACCRMAQLLIGDVGFSQVSPVFRGYVSSLHPVVTDVAAIADQPIWVGEQASFFAHQLALSLTIAMESDDPLLAMEMGRLAVAMRISSNDLVTLYVDQIGLNSSPTADIHWLICLALSDLTSLNHEPAKQVKRVADNLANLDLKRERKEREAGRETGGEVDRNWGARMQELLIVLRAKIPSLENWALAEFEGRAGQLFLMELFQEENQDDALDKIFQHLQNDPSHATIEHFRRVIATGTLQHQDFFRQGAQLPQFQELSILALTRWPQEQDRTWYRLGMGRNNLTLVKESAIAIRRLAAPPEPEDLVTALLAAKRLGWDAPQVSVRDQLMLLLSREGDAVIPYRFQQPKLRQETALEQWEVFLKGKFPQQFAVTNKDQPNWQAVFQNVDWSTGDPLRGKQLFVQLKCAQCHGAIQALGPSLTGISQRFSRPDLFQAIAEPDRRISDRYRATLVETVDGKFYRGMVIYQSVDGITLQDGDGNTIRLNRDSIERQSDSKTSLMPTGLLDGLQPQQFADLWEYLRQL